MGQSHKIVDHTDGDQYPEDDEEFALLAQIGLAGFPDDIGDIQHGLMCRHVLRLVCLDD